MFRVTPSYLQYTCSKLCLSIRACNNRSCTRMYITVSRHAYLPIENTRRKERKNGDVINLFAQRIAIIPCIKSIAAIDGQILSLGSTLGTLYKISQPLPYRKRYNTYRKKFQEFKKNYITMKHKCIGNFKSI